MKTAKTQLHEKQIEQIEASGVSVYQFLREAVALKLKNEENKITELLVEEKLKKHTADLDKLFEKKVDLLEERLLAVVAISQKLLTESIEKDDSYKSKTVENLRKISARIKD